MVNQTTVAAAFEPLLRSTLGPRPAVGFEFWDGSTIQPDGASPGTMRVRSEDALRHLIWAPGELGVARAFVSATVD
ncbi:SAM-dependent methyltransferase, partial [Nocardia sp. NPDC058497]